MPGKTDATLWKSRRQMSDIALGSLPSSYLQQFIDGHEWLYALSTNLITTVLPAKSVGCTSCLSRGLGISKCRTRLSEWWTSTAIQAIQSGRIHADPLTCLEELGKSALETFKYHSYEQTSYSLEVCRGCQGNIPKLIKAAKLYIWDEVPYAFRLKEREEGVECGYERFW